MPRIRLTAEAEVIRRDTPSVEEFARQIEQAASLGDLQAVMDRATVAVNSLDDVRRLGVKAGARLHAIQHPDA